MPIVPSEALLMAPEAILGPYGALLGQLRGSSGALLGFTIRCSFAILGGSPPRIERTCHFSSYEALLMAPGAILGQYGALLGQLRDSSGALLGFT